MQPIFRILFILLLLPLAFGAAYAQQRVKSLHPDSIAHIPLNRCFIQDFDAAEPDGGVVAIKATVNVQQLVPLIDSIHRSTAVRVVQKGKPVTVWPKVEFPVRFYIHHDMVMRQEQRTNYTLLTFWTQASDEKMPVEGKRYRRPGHRLGVTGEEVDYLQFAINRLVYGAQLKGPFLTGSNINSMFISAAERDTMGLNFIEEVRKYANNQTGGMHENWSINRFTVDGAEVRADWYPVHIPPDVEFDYETLNDSARFLNGSTLELENGRISAYGGNGYGTFLWTDYRWLGDTATLGYEYVTGHGWDSLVTLYYTSYNAQGHPTQRVTLGRFGGELDFNDAWLAQQLAVKGDTARDTLVYRYGPGGRLYSISPSLATLKRNNQLTFPPIELFSKPATNITTYNAFYQLFANHKPLEEVVLGHFNFLPRLLVIETFANGVWVIRLNEELQQYQFMGVVVLE